MYHRNFLKKYLSFSMIFIFFRVAVDLQLCLLLTECLTPILKAESGFQLEE